MSTETPILVGHDMARIEPNASISAGMAMLNRLWLSSFMIVILLASQHLGCRRFVNDRAGSVGSTACGALV